MGGGARPGGDLGRPAHPLTPLPVAFFLQPTADAARALLGKRLVRRFDDGSTLILRIVETEAYTHDDPASHAFRGRTRANAAMFGPPGHAYVHINYGVHHCLNVVCQPEGVGEAVLLRAVEPEDGVGERSAWAGPGRLARRLGVDKPGFDHAPLLAPDAPLLLADGPAPERIVTTTRIGITKAADRPWRFYDPDSRLVSRR